MNSNLTLIGVLAITALSNSAYALVAPFLPFEFEKKGISQDVMGYVFSLYSLSIIIASPIIGKSLQSFGRRNFIMFGLILMCFSFVSFGILHLIKNPELYIILTMLIRALQGLATAALQTTCYSVITN